MSNIKKLFLIKLEKWKSVAKAGGEEFDLGFKIRKLNKKNIKPKSAGYSGYWCDLLQRSKRIIERTEKYIPIFLKKKKFDFRWVVSTASGQALSSFSFIINIFYFIYRPILWIM